MARLFGKNALKTRARTINTADVLDKINLIKAWHADYLTGSLKADNETSREQQYNQDFFVKILGYCEKPTIPFTLQPKASTSSGQIPDAVLGYNDPDSGIEHVAAVVELKGAKIDLDRPQRREGNLSPVQQAFKYQRLYRNCPFVIVSNFQEFRLYNDNILDYERWTLDDLVNPKDDYLGFKTWYVLLRSENFTSSDGQSGTLGLLSDIRRDQDQIGIKFYDEYRTARIELLRDLYRNNEMVQSNIDLGIEKAQKLVDRVVFCCFAEDRGLLPDDTLARVVRHADQGFGTLRGGLDEFFAAVDAGSHKLGIPTGYNGGLFQYDAELASLVISDNILRRLTDLSAYNFVEDLSVTILGHIFEQSITDLEEIRETIHRAKIGELRALSKRKAEGVFYTPDYIVRFILDRTLGDYLRAKEEQCRAAAGLNNLIQDSTYYTREIKAYRAYQEILKDIRIVDPACGSGAFLVHVFDFLMLEYKRVGSVLGDLFSTEEFTRHILQKNVYGVDLNEESVEITKLSLWLKTATVNEKLTSLDETIKCGNSVISSAEVSGDKAFDWRQNFPEVFSAGGFDLVVGNPPYVNARSMLPADRRYLRTEYKQLKGAYDLYVVFLLLAMRIIKPNGRFGWIIPNRFLISDYAREPFNYLNGLSQLIIVEISRLNVFSGVGVYPVILIGDTNKSDKILKFIASNVDQLQSGKLKEAAASFHRDYGSSLNMKSAGIRINAGTTGFEAQVVKRLINEQRNGIPFAVSGNVDPYTLDTRSVRYMKSRYVEPFVALDSPDIAQSKYNFWNSPKIVIAGMTKRIEAVYVHDPLALGVGVYGIYDFGGYDPFALLGVLNSQYLSEYFVEAFNDKHLAGGYLAVNKSNLEALPIPAASALNGSGIGPLAELAQRTRQDLKAIDLRFQTLVKTESNIVRWPSALTDWWDLTSENIIASLKSITTLKQRADILLILEDFAPSANSLSKELNQVLESIEDIVVGLY